MGREIHKLDAKWVKGVQKVGYHADGGNLYLQVSSFGTKAWVLRYMLDGKARWMGLGSVQDVTLAEARGKATEARKLVKQGLDPIDQRNEQKMARLLEKAKAMTFDQCAAAFIAANKTGWKNAKHVAQWESTLATYASPIIGALPVQDIETSLVMRVLDPIWNIKPETASRVRGRVESVLAWATTRKLRTGDNPAQWKGHLENLLPHRTKIIAVKHHAALPYVEIAAFVEQLKEQGGVAARALELLILTAARTGDVLGMVWSEVDMDHGVWVIPAVRMKAKREHRVPLSARAMEILREMEALRGDGFVFPGAKEGKGLSNMAMTATLRRMGRGDITVHGFRSTFRDWAAEIADHPHEVAEMALAHIVGNKVEAAYRRGNLFKKRIKIMDDWARFCSGIQQSGKGNVVSLRGAA